MAVNYHEMTEAELDKQLGSARTELRELRFTYAVSKSLQNTARPNQLKKSIARILTVRRAKELAQEKTKA